MRVRFDKHLCIALSVLVLLSLGAFALLYHAAAPSAAPAAIARKKGIRLRSEGIPAAEKPAGEQISVTFTADGFPAYRKTVTAGEAYGALPSPELSGRTFGGWYTAADGGGKSVTADTPVTASADHALYGLWHKNPLVTFDPNGGSIGASAVLEVPYGKPFELPDAASLVVSRAQSSRPSVPGFALIGGSTFSGWSTRSDGAGTFYPNGARITLTGDVTLYAQWDNFLRASSARSEPYLVTLTEPFYLCTHEVTQGEYERLCFYGGKSPSASYGKGEDVPAYYVSWYDAVVYCNLRSAEEGLSPVYSIRWQKDARKWPGVRSDGGGRYCAADGAEAAESFALLEADFTANGYRLPTEAEWQYAALGSYVGNGWTGYGEAVFAGYAGGDEKPAAYLWYADNSRSRAHAVGQKEPNSYGLYDMSGNVWEWCWDWYAPFPARAVTDYAFRASASSSHVLKSGSWSGSAEGCSVSRRTNGAAPYRYYYYGFRVARSAR